MRTCKLGDTKQQPRSLTLYLTHARLLQKAPAYISWSYLGRPPAPPARLLLPFADPGLCGGEPIEANAAATAAGCCERSLPVTRTGQGALRL